MEFWIAGFFVTWLFGLTIAIIWIAKTSFEAICFILEYLTTLETRS
jgi:hypothetical protein